MSTEHAEHASGSRIGLLIKRIIFLILPAVVLVAGIAGFAVMGALSPEPEQAEDTVEAVPVLTAAAEPTSLYLTVHSQGEVTPRAEVTLSPEVGGRVAFVSPKLLPGGQFAKGDVLMRIDPREYRLQVTQAEANVATARTALIRERSEAETAASDVRDLGLSDVSDLTLRRPQLAEAEARLASAEAALAEAELDLARTELRAPFAGRTRSKSIDLGAYVSPGMAAAEVFSSDTVEVPIPLTDRDLASLGLGIGFSEDAGIDGPPVRLTASIAGEDHTWSGRIVRTDSGFDRDTRVLFAYVLVEDPYGAGADNGTPLAAGLFVHAEITGRRVEDAVAIPRTGLRGKDEVFVVENGDTLRIRKVRVESSDREQAILSAGLVPGEIVITSPVKGAADGMAVTPVTPAEAGGGDGASYDISEN